MSSIEKTGRYRLKLVDLDDRHRGLPEIDWYSYKVGENR